MDAFELFFRGITVMVWTARPHRHQPRERCAKMVVVEAAI
jgi:hypothetical protein